MTDIRNAKLVLKTSDFTSKSDYVLGQSYSNQNGTINAKCSTITWNNINLRVLLGDLYTKYNSFNLCLNTISTSTANTIDTNQECKNVVMRMSGLSWLNQTYSTTTLSNTSKSTICTFNFNPSNSISQAYYSSNVVTFGKNAEVVNLTIDYSRISDDSMSSTIYGAVINTLTGTALINVNTMGLSAANASINIGSSITGAGIPNGTIITGFITSTLVNISNYTTAALNATAINIYPLTTFPNVVLIFDIYGIPNDGDLPERISFKN